MTEDINIFSQPYLTIKSYLTSGVERWKVIALIMWVTHKRMTLKIFEKQNLENYK